MPQSPPELRDLLFRIFPAYQPQWESADNPFVSDDGTFSYHGLMIDFTEFFGRNLASLSEKQLREFGGLVNAVVAADGPLENAVSTCLFEHLHQIKAAKALRPFLSPVAKEKSHA